jgi:uncharacterized membrane protein
MDTSHPIRRHVTALMLLTLFGMLLCQVRYYFTGEYKYFFLIYNLGLAWIPMWFALLGYNLLKNGSKVVPLGWLSFGFWLVFFPNAPYILTDILHFNRFDGTVPWWFDLGMILTFAITGLLCGLASQFVVHEVVTARTNAVFGWVVAITTSLLAGFGIYLGRVLRWNSWDLWHNSGEVLRDIADRVTMPLAHSHAWGLTALMGTFLVLMYLAIWTLAHREQLRVALLPRD